MPSRTLLPLFSSFFLLLLLLFPVEFCNGSPIMDLNSVGSGELEVMGSRVCSGRVGDCLEEDLVDSESNRRALLMRRRYISYETLTRDLVPCDRPGASYYNCRTPGVANSYNRGCEVITRCARGD